MLRIPYEEACWNKRVRIRMGGGGVINHMSSSLPGTTINICMCTVSSGYPFEPIKCYKPYSKEKNNIGQLQKWVGDGGGSLKSLLELLLELLPPKD